MTICENLLRGRKIPPSMPYHQVPGCRMTSPRPLHLCRPKFNSKIEAMKGPSGKYLSIQRFRFYIKCTVCSRPITFLTDPKNSGSTHLSPIVRRSLSPAPPHESPSPACATTHDPRKWLPVQRPAIHPILPPRRCREWRPQWRHVSRSLCQRGGIGTEYGHFTDD